MNILVVKSLAVLYIQRYIRWFDKILILNNILHNVSTLFNKKVILV